MIADLSLYCRRVFIAAAAVAGLGIAGSSYSAQAHVATSPVVSPAAQSQGVDRAIVVADNDDDNDHGHKNGKGKKSGNNDHNSDWNKNGNNRNSGGNGQNWMATTRIGRTGKI